MADATEALVPSAQDILDRFLESKPCSRIGMTPPSFGFSTLQIADRDFAISLKLSNPGFGVFHTVRNLVTQRAIGSPAWKALDKCNKAIFKHLDEYVSVAFPLEYSRDKLLRNHFSTPIFYAMAEQQCASKLGHGVFFRNPAEVVIAGHMVCGCIGLPERSLTLVIY